MEQAIVRVQLRATSRQLRTRWVEVTDALAAAAFSRLGIEPAQCVVVAELERWANGKKSRSTWSVRVSW